MKKFRTSQSAFTLIELLVTTGIFLVLTSVVLARYHSYNIKTTVVNTAETIALSLREAQVYGTSGKVMATVPTECGGSSFNCPYGARFTNNSSSYVVFADKDGDGAYTGAPELVATVALPAGITITALEPAPALLDVVFTRPFPDARINNNVANTTASITVSNSTNSAIVRITSAGQISIE